MNGPADIQAVIWDWNGTLLDDVDICVQSINLMLTERKLHPLRKEEYTMLFDFPVVDYYRKIGFDLKKEDFSSLADEYMALYFTLIKNAALVEGVISVLQDFSNRGLQQLIISAMRQEDLDASVFRFGIRSYFSGIHGAKDHYAHGKIEHATRIFRERFPDPEKVLLVGDTSHDAELAATLGCQCILFSGGHFSRPRLAQSKYPVIERMGDLILFAG